MSGRQSAPVANALRAISRGMTIADAARRYGVADRTLRRALRAAGVPPKPVGRPAAIQGS